MSFYVKKNGQPVEVAGRPGPPGPQGPPGEPGSSAIAYHRHNQGTPSEVWLIEHNLGFNPAGIVVQDSGGTEHEGFGVDYVDSNNLILSFSFAFGGTADLS